MNAVNPLRGIHAPLRCGKCGRMKFEAALEVTEGQPRVVALVCGCGERFPVDTHGLLPRPGGRSGLNLIRSPHG